MRLLFFILCCLASFHGLSQKGPIKFGDVSIEELRQKTYPRDSSAAAYVIADFGESDMDYIQNKGFIIRFKRIRRVKILKKDGYSNADFQIPLYHNTRNEENLTGLKAVTYNLEGSKIVETKMKTDNLFKEKFDKNINLVKFTLPNVKVGSVIEVAYEISSEFLFNFQDWEFQSTIPIQWSEYRAHIPEYFDYQRYMQGYVALSVNEAKTSSDAITLTTKERSGDRVTQTSYENEQINYLRSDFRWAAKDVPAFKEEPYMNNTIDYISKINFELAYIKLPNRPMDSYMSSWEGLNKEFLDSDDFGKAVAGSGYLKDLAVEAVGSSSDPQEKAAKVYAFVKSNVEWDGYYRKYVDETFKKVLENKKGNSAEINLMLVAMLQKIGLDASPVLISTRNHGFIRQQFPVSSQFNYVICAWTYGDKTVLLDATDRSLPIHLLPERCLNGEGLRISKDKPGWIPVTSSVKSKTVVNYDLALNGDGEMIGEVAITRDGYDAQRTRKTFATKGEGLYLEELATTYGWEFQKSAFENAQNVNETFQETHEIKINEHVQAAGDVLYLNPLVTGQLAENPFKAETRVFPVDFGSPSDKIYMGKFTIPAGYVVEEMPKPKMIMLPKSGGKYIYSVSMVGDKIQFSSQLSINQPLFAQEEYANLREFFNQVVAKQSEQIVIKKKQG